MQYAQILTLSLSAALLSTPIEASEVESVFFVTNETLPVFQPPPSVQREYALFQRSLPFLSEGLVVLSVISFGNEATDLTAEKQQMLLNNFSQVYGEIAQDSTMHGVRHTLDYVYSKTAPTQGHYYAYIPDEVNADTPSIIFLHGFGGNFLYYTWLLKSEYPDHIILLPTYTYSWFDGSRAYLEEAVADFESRHAVELSNPWLFALSAGGPAGFKIYNEAPQDFSGYVCLASAPLGLSPKGFNRDLDILMINGSKDDRIRIDKVRRMATNFKAQIPGLRYEEIDSDHFFMLTEREQCFDLVNEFMAEH